MHYKRWRKTGDAGHALPRREQPTSPKTCNVDGCDQGGKLVRGMCKRHYTRWIRTGDVQRLAAEPGTVHVESVIFNGVVFRRYPNARQMSHRRYFKPGGADVVRGVESLHREIWKAANGPIPRGYHVHHMDENYSNNNLTNLEILRAGRHTKEHHPKGVPASDTQRAHLDEVRHLASEWHRSAEGRAWHREHARKTGFGSRT